jgi:aminopeptidase N
MSFLQVLLLTLSLMLAETMTDGTNGTAGAKEAGIIKAAYDQRMDLYDVKFYEIDLTVTDTSTYLSGATSVLLKTLEKPVNELVFDLLSDLFVDSVWINGENVPFDHDKDQLIIRPEEEIPGEETLKVTVFYAGLGKQKQWISGIYNARQDFWNKRITWTLSEPFAARNWFPCKQVLADKADSAAIFITTDSTLKAGSNGLLENVVTLPEGRIRYEWKTRYPIAYYLISFAVGDYADYSFYVQLPGEDDSLLVQNYIYDTLAFFEQNKSDIDKTADLLKLYSDLFGTYPFRTEKYGHCIVPSGGGMEHQTMTTLGSFYFLLVAHELAHQWFGDYVTCGNWQDIWMNEGFASYAEYLASQYLQSQEQADLWMADAHELIKSQSDGSVFVPEADADNEERLFDYRLSYKKGAAILHMIRGEIQDDPLFFSILRDYLNQFRNNVAVGQDFKKIVEEKTGRDFTSFFEQWYYGSGYPSVTVNWKQEKDTLYLYTFLSFSATEPPSFDMLTGYKIMMNDRDTTIYHRHDKRYEEWKMVLPGNAKNIRVDPDKWLLIKVAGVNNLSRRDPGKRFYLAPNPASNKVGIYFEDKVPETRIYVIDSVGKILFTDTSRDFPLMVDLKGYKPGSYIVIAQYEDRIFSEKFVVVEP